MFLAGHGSLQQAWPEEASGEGGPPSLAFVGPVGHAQPIDAYRSQILSAVEHNRVTIIVAPTGCGKSTAVPQMFLSPAGTEQPLPVVCTQPRRVAATSLARHVAKIRGTSLGDEVGYRIGGCSEVSRSGRTRIVYTVTAVAIAQCIEQTSSFSYLIIDEVHTRDAFIDVLLAVVVGQLLPQNRGARVVLMSAAMDAVGLAHYFERWLDEPPALLELGGCKPYPVRETYLDDLRSFFAPRGISRSLADALDGDDLAALLADFVLAEHRKRQRQPDGHLEAFLVFLPGKRDVNQVAEQLEEKGAFEERLVAKVVYGGQTIEVQERSLQELDPTRRLVILATDVVESSVTIPDVDVVIDLCEHKRLRWDAGTRQSLLTATSICRDEALQRAGRAGRLRPGEVVRLVSKSVFAGFQQHVQPEICHSRLETVILSLFERRIGSPREFLQKLPDPPSPEQVDRAMVKLMEIGALRKVQGGQELTHLGLFLQRMPLDPDLGNLVMQGLQYGVAEECIILAAIAQRGDPFLENPEHDLQAALQCLAVREACCDGADSAAMGGGARYPGDLTAGLRAYQAWQQQSRAAKHRWPLWEEWQWCADHYLSLARLHEVEEAVYQIHEVLTKLQYSTDAPLADRKHMRQRRREMAPGLKPPVPRASCRDPAKEVAALLRSCHDPRASLLVQWCLAAAFAAGIVEVRNGACSAEVKYRPRGHRGAQIAGFLRQNGFSVRDSRYGNRGDVFVTFASSREARRALQVAALVSNRSLPYSSAVPWGRPHERPSWSKRKCYGEAQCRLLPTSAASPLPADDVTLVAAEMLAMMGGGGGEGRQSYLCTKCSVVPPGILPLVLMATYPAAAWESSGGYSMPAGRLRAKFWGVLEVLDFQEPPSDVRRLVDSIRNGLGGEEFRLPAHEREGVVQGRADAAVQLMQHLHQGRPPMQRSGANPMGLFNARLSNLAALRSVMGSLDAIDLDDFGF